MIQSITFLLSETELVDNFVAIKGYNSKAIFNISTPAYYSANPNDVVEWEVDVLPEELKFTSIEDMKLFRELIKRNKI